MSILKHISPQGRRLSLPTLCLLLGLFSLGSWLVSFMAESHGPYEQILANLGLVVMLSCAYLYIRKLEAPALNIHLCTPLLILCSIGTPVILQTDPFRYVWDGLHSLQGIDPYRFAPQDSPLFSHISWAKHINHPHLPTIYPPAAQLFFHASCYLNPWPLQADLNSWQVMFGWKMMVGFAAALLIYSLRHRRWDLVLLHPLFLLTVLGNAHIDSLLIAALGVYLSMQKQLHNPVPKVFSLSIAILIKWLPLLYLPGHFIYLKHQRSLRKAIIPCFLLLALVILPTVFHALKEDSHFFHSLGVYAEHWMFFPFLFYVLNNIFILGGASKHIFLAKLTALLSGCLMGAFLTLRYWQTRISLRLYLLLISLCAFALSPTLHPWYLLTILPLGLPYFRVLKTPWVWPMLSLLSQSYYLENRENQLIRWGVYGIVTLCIAIDVKRLNKKLGFKRALQ